MAQSAETFVTNIQKVIERQRSDYALLEKPLLAYMAEVHGLTQREFADIFNVSKGQADKILNHKVLPSLELAVRMARYFETTVDELFGWRVDDNGDRRALLVQLPGTKKVIRLNGVNSGHGSDFSAMVLMVKIVEAVKSGEGVIKLCEKLWREHKK